MKKPPPAYFARVQDGARVREKTLADLPRFPSVGRYVERHINHDRRSDNVVARNATPKAAVIRIGTVIAHRKITIVRHVIRKLDVGITRRCTSRRSRFTRTDGVILVEFLAIDV